MKLRYMIDYVLRDSDKPMYEPVGVWVQGPGPGLDVEMFYIESKDALVAERKDEAMWVINRLVEYELTSLPEDFLEYHKASRSAYDGHFGEIVETEDFESIQECGQAVLKKIRMR